MLKGADLSLLDLSMFFIVDPLLGEKEMLGGQLLLAQSRVACGRSSDATASSFRQMRDM